MQIFLRPALRDGLFHSDMHLNDASMEGGLTCVPVSDPAGKCGGLARKGVLAATEAAAKVTRYGATSAARAWPP